MDYKDVYEATTKIIRDNMKRHNKTVMLEPVASAEDCFVAVSRSSLLKIKDDKDFVIALYCKVLDRLPSSHDVDNISKRIRGKKDGRKSEIDRILSSKEYENKKVTVTIT